MEVFTKSTSTVFIMSADGSLRWPTIDEAKHANYPKQPHTGRVVDFGPAKGTYPISKCRCKSDEIIIEKTKDDTLKITTAHDASQDLYSLIVALAAQGDYKMEIGKCENMRDMYDLDKVVQLYMENYNQT